ncbi:MAG: DUF2442 domain-containing protein [Caldilineaceae bacterium]|nr:DUF2442 domain-containing protein [Caldilineaceae bacterium]
MLPRVKSVSYLDGYRLKLRFTNKTEGIIDFRQKIVGRGGVFKPLEDIEFFKQVVVDPISGTLIWPNEVDFCPDVLYQLVTSNTTSVVKGTNQTLAVL